MVIRSLLEVTLETSVLIGIIALIRKCFRKYMSPNLVYLLWIFVLAGILVPVGIKLEIKVPKSMENIIVINPAENVWYGKTPCLSEKPLK